MRVLRRGLAGPVLPAAVLVLAAFAVTEAWDRAGGRGPAAAVLLNLLLTLPLLLVRRAVLVPALVGTAAMVALLAGAAAPTVAGVVGLAASFFAVAAHGLLPVSLLLTAPFAVNVIDPFDSDRPPTVTGLLLLVLLLAAQALGTLYGQRRKVVAERDTALEHAAVAQERARIARELHDIVAHHVSTIAVQADVARLTVAGMPEEGRAHLDAIGTAARAALTELRGVLTVLRRDADAPVERAPQPGLARLGELIDAAEAVGTPVRLVVSGPARPLPPAVDLAAFRIVQEALTNARRHAPRAAPVTIELRYAEECLSLGVRDQGSSPTQLSRPGHGLAGMRERAAGVGGVLELGPVAGGGFAVTAELPIPRVAT